MVPRRRDPIWRVGGALLFVIVTVTLAKVAQYAAVAHLGSSIGFATALIIGAAPVVAVARLVNKHARKRRTIDAWGDRSGGSPPTSRVDV